MSRRLVLIYLLFIFCLSVFGQDRYMVFFTDKDNSPFSTSNPVEFLSQRALDRRQNQNIAISQQDLPVNSSYVNAVKALGVETYFTSKWMNGVLVQMTQSEAAAVEALAVVSSVEFVAPGDLLSPPPPGEVDDIEDETALVNNLASDQLEVLEINEMHRAGFTGEGMLVAVFDDGFQNISAIDHFDHIYSNDRLLYSKDFVLNRNTVENGRSHGLRVLSIMGANGVDYKGAIPEATYILSVTEAPGEYRVEEYNWLFAAEMADSAGVDVINTSLGYSNNFSDPSMNYTVQDMDGATTVISRAANIATSKGILIVASAGNGNPNDWTSVVAPADAQGVLAVGAINNLGETASFSLNGPTADNRIKPDLTALGVNTIQLLQTGTISLGNGTSFSSPLIAGLATGLWQAFPSKSNFEIMELLKASGHLAQSPNNEQGYGIPGFMKASILVGEATANVDFTPFPNPVADNNVSLRVDPSLNGQLIDVQLVNMRGELMNSYRFVSYEARPNVSLNLPNMSPGVYLIRMSSQQGALTKKIIKY